MTDGLGLFFRRYVVQNSLETLVERDEGGVECAYGGYSKGIGESQAGVLRA